MANAWTETGSGSVKYCDVTSCRLDGRRPTWDAEWEGWSDGASAACGRPCPSSTSRSDLSSGELRTTECPLELLRVTDKLRVWVLPRSSSAAWTEADHCAPRRSRTTAESFAPGSLETSRAEEGSLLSSSMSQTSDSAVVRVDACGVFAVVPRRSFFVRFVIRVAWGVGWLEIEETELSSVSSSISEWSAVRSLGLFKNADSEKNSFLDASLLERCVLDQNNKILTGLLCCGYFLFR